MRLDPPPFRFSQITADPDLLRRGVAAAGSTLVAELDADYRPWRKVRAIARDRSENAEEVWLGLKVRRLGRRARIDVEAMDGEAFSLSITPKMQESLHRIDQALGGGAAAFDHAEGVLADAGARRRFAIRSLMDEAIESSMLEGAATTRQDAMDLLRSGRSPRSTHELMVVNNYVAMQRIKGWLERELTPGLLCELQALLTDGTLEDPNQSGRFRRADEPVRVVDARTNQIIYEPPPAGEIERRVATVCRFANATHTGSAFLHPILKACVLHFLIGYEHPFADGNGRTARAVFFWYALRHGYRVFEFLVVSDLIRQGYAKYPQAYVDTETDDADLTYFVHYKLGIIERAIDQLRDHIAREETRITSSLRLVAEHPSLNLRQRLLLEHALRHPMQVYTVRSHSVSNGVSLNTARSDLEGLREQGVLGTHLEGREVRYMLLPSALEELS
ncbi:MAG: Fic family protein [Phycisphaerales bacterium]